MKIILVWLASWSNLDNLSTTLLPFSSISENRSKLSALLVANLDIKCLISSSLRRGRSGKDKVPEYSANFPVVGHLLVLL